MLPCLPLQVLIVLLPFDHVRPNYFITSRPDFLNKLLGATYLFFQTDSAFCCAGVHHLDDFLGYDYVGAPWNTTHEVAKMMTLHGHGGNGGLSLRKRPAMLRVLDEFPHIEWGIKMETTKVPTGVLGVEKGWWLCGSERLGGDAVCECEYVCMCVFAVAAVVGNCVCSVCVSQLRLWWGNFRQLLGGVGPQRPAGPRMDVSW